MGKGGKRPGAGRKPGVPNKASAARAAAVAASGLTPLDYMLAILRDENKTAEQRFAAAQSAAPYVHPRLSSVESKVRHERVEALTVDELVRIARGGSLGAAEAGIHPAKPH